MEEERRRQEEERKRQEEKQKRQEEEKRRQEEQARRQAEEARKEAERQRKQLEEKVRQAASSGHTLSDYLAVLDMHFRVNAGIYHYYHLEVTTAGVCGCNVGL